MDGIETMLADFQRLKKICRDLEGQKIVVGIVGSADSAIVTVHNADVPGLTEVIFARVYQPAIFFDALATSPQMPTGCSLSICIGGTEYGRD